MNKNRNPDRFISLLILTQAGGYHKIWDNVYFFLFPPKLQEINAFFFPFVLKYFTSFQG